MLILERAITISNAEDAKKWLLKKIQHLKNSYGFHYLNPRRLVTFKFSNSKLIGFLILRNPKNTYYWEVDYVWVDKGFRGKSITEKLYQIVIDQHLILSSGKSQTKFARAFWFKLIRKNNFDIYAFDLKTDQSSQVFIEDNEIWCSLDYLYTDDLLITKEHDVRLIALKK
jgi:hypothetical protein